MAARDNLQPMQFFHGSLDKFNPGDIIDPSRHHESSMPDSKRGTFYFTNNSRTAGGIARYKNLMATGKVEPAHLYEVRPTKRKYSVDRSMKNDPGRHFKTKYPVEVVGEVLGPYMREYKPRNPDGSLKNG